MVGAVADCLILTFRAVAGTSKLLWTGIHCNAVGTLDRVEGVMQFTRFELSVNLEVPAEPVRIWPGMPRESGARVLDF